MASSPKIVMMQLRFSADTSGLDQIGAKVARMRSNTAATPLQTRGGMPKVQTLRINAAGNAPAFLSRIRSGMSGAVDGASQLRGALGSALSGGGIGGAAGAFRSLGAAIMGGPVVAVAALGAGIAALGIGAVVAGLGIAAKLGAAAEQTRVRFQTMFNSAEKGDAVLGMLNSFANVTPFKNDELIKAGGILSGFGVEAGQLKSTLKAIGDASAGSGKDLAELSTIYGKVMAKGKADTEALNQMQEGQIPIIAELGKIYGKSGEDVLKMAEQGEIGAGAIQQAFLNMTGSGGQFNDSMAKLAETNAGTWSTMQGKITYSLEQIGLSLQPIVKLGLDWAMQWVDAFQKIATDGTVIDFLATVFRIGVMVFNGLSKTVSAFGAVLYGVFMTIVRPIRIVLYTIVTALAEVLSAVVSGFWNGINLILEGWNKLMDMIGNTSLKVDPIKHGDTEKLFKSVANEARDIVDENGKKLSSGEDWKGTGDKISAAWTAVTNPEADPDNQKALTWISDWQKNQKQDLKERTEAAQKLKNEEMAIGKLTLDKKGKNPSEKEKDRADKPQVDDLTRIGLYNFGAPQVPSADIERNNLLRQIVQNTYKPYTGERSVIL